MTEYAFPYCSSIADILAPPFERERITEKIRSRPGRVLDVHFKGGFTDGVSLVSETMAKALEEIDPSIHVEYCAGKFGDKIDPRLQNTIPLMDYQSPQALALHSQIFAKEVDPTDINERQTAILKEIRQSAEEIYIQVCGVLREKAPRVVQIRNVFSMPLNIPTALAWSWAMQNPEFEEMRFFLMHHDFSWEKARAHNYETKYPLIGELVKELYPPKFTRENNRVTHGVLNIIAQKELYKRTGIFATRVPDLIQTEKFSQYANRTTTENLPENEFNWREYFKVSESDLMIAIPTRIVPRKAIELAIQIVGEITARKDELIGDKIGRFNRKFKSDSKIILVLPQIEDTDGPYLEALRVLATASGVTLRYAGDTDSATVAEPKPADFYSIYGQVDWALLTSIWEGFGNNWLETVASGTPHSTILHLVYEIELARKFRGRGELARQAVEIAPAREAVQSTLETVLQQLGVLEEFEISPTALTQTIHVLPEQRVKMSASGIISMLREPELAQKTTTRGMKRAREYDAKQVVKYWWYLQVPRTRFERLRMILADSKGSNSLLINYLLLKMRTVLATAGLD